MRLVAVVRREAEARAVRVPGAETVDRPPGRSVSGRGSPSSSQSCCRSSPPASIRRSADRRPAPGGAGRPSRRGRVSWRASPVSRSSAQTCCSPAPRRWKSVLPSTEKLGLAARFDRGVRRGIRLHARHHRRGARGLKIRAAAATGTEENACSMDLLKKLEILADAAKYDASCASSGTAKRNSLGQSFGVGSTEGMGICHAYAPDGRCISLLEDPADKLLHVRVLVLRQPPLHGFLAFAWHGPEGQRMLVAVNYADDRGQCRVRLPFADLGGRTWRLRDLPRDGDLRPRRRLPGGAGAVPGHGSLGIPRLRNHADPVDGSPLALRPMTAAMTRDRGVWFGMRVRSSGCAARSLRSGALSLPGRSRHLERARRR